MLKTLNFEGSPYRFKENYEKLIELDVFKREKDFIILRHSIYENLLFNKVLTLRQLKVLLLILRLSIGGQKLYARITLDEFSVINVYQPDAKKILTKLEYLNLLLWDKDKSLVWLTPKLITKNEDLIVDNWSRLLSENITQFASKSHKKKFDFCKSVAEN